jgi:hypothetical protein
MCLGVAAVAQGAESVCMGGCRECLVGLWDGLVHVGYMYRRRRSSSSLVMLCVLDLTVGSVAGCIAAVRTGRHSFGLLLSFVLLLRSVRLCLLLRYPAAATAVGPCFV